MCRAFGCTLTELYTVIPLDWIQKQQHIWWLDEKAAGTGTRKRRMGPVRMDEDEG